MTAPAFPVQAYLDPPAGGMGLVEGRVMTRVDGAFRPVAAARVVLAGGARTVTDVQGRYALADVPAGARDVQVTHPDFNTASHPVVVMPGVGTPRAHILLAPRAYGLRQAARIDADVTGAVYDPRGAALAGATVTLGCARALGGRGANITTTTDGDGFFAATLRNLAEEAGAATVTYAAAGTTPGGVPVQTDAVGSAALEGARLALNIQALSFPDPGAPRIVGSAFVGAGATGEIAAANLSARADEYYLELVSDANTFDALPLTVGAGQATFRVPAALPDTLFGVRVVPFGRSSRRSTASSSFITVYTQDDLERDISYGPTGGVVDISPAIDSINVTRFMAGDIGRFSFTLINANPRITPELEVSGTMPAGTVGVSSSVGALDGPDGSGTYRLRGLSVPSGGELPVTIDFRSPLSAQNGQTFGPASLAVTMPAVGITKITPPDAPQPLVIAGVDTAAFAFAKAIADDGAAGDGKGKVVLTIRPTGTLAGAAFKLTDATKTEAASVATAAIFTGTADLPAAGEPLGLTTADVLDLEIDGKAAPQMRIFSSNYDVETLVGQINAMDGLAGAILASRGGGKLVIERLAQGASRSLEILATPQSAHLRAVLGLPTGLRRGGCQADFSAATAVQPNGTAWSVLASGMAWNPASGLTSATIVLRPPAAFQPGDLPSSPITLTYGILKLNGAAATFGGGVGASVGPRTVSYNMVAPFTTVTNDRTFTRTGADAPAVAGL